MVPQVVYKYYPHLASLLEEEDSTVLTEESLSKNNVPALLEMYKLLGFNKDRQDLKGNSSYVSLLMRIEKYANPEVFTLGLKEVSDEYLKAKALKDMDASSIESKEYLQIKMLQGDKQAIEKYETLSHSSSSAAESLAKLRIIQAHQENKLDELFSSIKVTKDAEPLVAWKRARTSLLEVLSKPTITGLDLINKIPDMKLVETPMFVHDSKKALDDFLKLVMALPYDMNEDKEAIIRALSNYMENKDLVKMLPQFKDKWQDGRLIFEIGDEESDLFHPFKGVLGTKYFVITVNPVDMLFCSTDQEYQSCFSLCSPHGSNNGLPNFIAHPSTAMCFLSSGSLSKPWKDEERYPGLSFKHIKIKARAFIYNDAAMKLAVAGRSYAPNEIQYADPHRDVNRTFRSQASLFLAKLLQVDLTKYGVPKKILAKNVNNNIYYNDDYRIDNHLSFDFKYYPIRPFDGNRWNEVYMDNLSCDYDPYDDDDELDSADWEYRHATGNGCCSRFCSDCGTLYRAYRSGLDMLKGGEKDDD